MREQLWSKAFVMICATNFLFAFGFYLLMPTLPMYLTKVMKLPESNVGLVLSSYTLATLLFRPFSGFLVDSYSRKKLLLLSLSLFTLFISGYLFAAGVFIFVVLRFFHGTSWAFTTVSASTIAIDVVPSSRRAQGIGYYGLSMNIAMAIAPLVGLEIYKCYGYTILIATAIVSSFLALALTFFIKIEERPLSVHKVKKISLDRFILMPALPIVFNLMLCAVSYGIIITYGALFAEHNNIAIPGLLFLFMAIGLGLSRVISGGLVDKGYLHNITVIFLTILGISLFVFALTQNIYVFSISSLFIGIGFGSIVPAFQTLFINMAHHDQRGTANSTYLTSFDLGIGFGMLLGGVLSEYIGLTNTFILGGVFCLLSVPYYLLITKKVYENRHII